VPSLKIDIIVDDQGRPVINRLEGDIKSLNQTVQNSNSGLKAHTEHHNQATGAVNAHADSVAGATRAILRAYAAYYVISAGVSAFGSALSSTMTIIDTYNLSVTKMAALMTGMMEGNTLSLADKYRQARAYAGELNVMIEQIDKNTLLTASDLRLVTEEMMKQGVLVDTTSQKQVEAFTQISNALAVISAGAPQKEIQLRQEIRALIQGQTRDTDQLAKMLDAQLNGKLKEEIALHKKNGDVVEWLGRQLEGFAAAQKDINGSWEAAKTTLQTVGEQIIRGSMGDAYREIIGYAQKLADWAQRHKEQIQEILSAGWDLIKASVMYIINMYKDMGPLLGVAGKWVMTMVYGFTAILDLIPKIKDQFKNLIPSVGGAMAGGLAGGLPGALLGGIIGTKAGGNKISQMGLDLSRQKELMGKIGEVWNPSNIQGWEGSNYGAKGTMPAIKPTGTEEATKALEKLKEKWAETAITLQGKIEMAGMDNASKVFVESRLEAEKLKKEFEGLPEPLKSSAYALIEANKRAEDFANVAKQDQKAIDDLTKSQQKGIDEYRKTEKAYSDLEGALNPLLAIQREYEANIQTISEAEAAGMVTNQQATALSLQALAERNKKTDEFRKNGADKIADDLKEKADYYKDLLGFEDKYHEKILAYIEARRKADIAAGMDVVAANAKAKKQTMQLSSDAFHKENSDRADAFSSMSQSFSAAAALYDEDSKARQALSAASKAATIAEMAVLVQKNILIAVGAVLQQGTGDPYSAFARMAAMVAVVTGILSIAGIAFGSSGGGADAAETEYKPASTVLGAEAGTASESVQKSWELMKDQYSMEYSKLTDIYNELRDLNNNITGLVSSILKTGTISSSSFNLPQNQTGVWADSEGFRLTFMNDVQKILFGPGVGGILGNLATKIGSAIFGGDVSYNFSGVGAMFANISVDKLIQGMEMAGKLFVGVQQVIDGGWFGDNERSYYEIYQKMDEGTQHMFTLVFKNMSQTLVSLAEGLGYDVNDALAYVFKFPRLWNLSELSGEELQDKLSAWINKIADTAAEDLFGDLLKVYQKVDEGMYETAIRLLTDKAVVMDILQSTGHAFTGTAREAIDLSEALISLAGDLDTLKEAASKYYDAFYTDAEKQARLKEQLGNATGYYGYTLPDTREAFRALMEGIDLTTDAGKEAYIVMLGLAESADQYYGTLEDLADQRANKEIELMELMGDKEGALALKRQLELAAMDASLVPLQQMIYALEDAQTVQEEAATAVTDAETALKAAFSAQKEALNTAYQLELDQANSALSAIKETVSELTASVNALKSAKEKLLETQGDEENRYKAAQAQLRNVLTQARAGNFSGVDGLDSALNTLTSASTDMYSSWIDYQRDQRKSLAAITELENLTSDQLSYQEVQETLMEQQIETLKSNHEAQLAALDAQLNTLLGIDTTVLSIDEAIAQYNAAKAVTEGQTPEALAILAELGRGQVAIAEYTAAGRSDLVTQAETYMAGLEAQLAAMGVAASVYAGDLTKYWTGTGTAGHYDVTQQGSVLLPEYQNQTSGGKSNYGDYYDDSYSASSSKSSIDLSGLTSEIKALREDMKAANYSIAKNTQKTASILNRWDGDGQPQERAY
jgi:hypothetical protein